MSVLGQKRFYVPARFITKKLGGKVTIYGGKTLYKNGRFEKEL